MVLPRVNNPVIAAARRAFESIWPDQGDFEFNFEDSTRAYAVISADEALAPLRKLHFPLRLSNPAPGCNPYVGCSDCRQAWPCRTARLIYSESRMP
ncbi:hypothetical protein FHT44_004984 [Mycolicibacterium sp. BK634]|nr:hypothetical protein [Mycolicibacterium sp. BK634]